MSSEKEKKKSFPKDIADALSNKAASALYSIKEAESVPDAIKKALSRRDNVLMLRINKDSLLKVDALVDAGIFKSRSESAAFLLSEGIKARKDLYEKISEKIKKIHTLKEELQEMIGVEILNEEQNIDSSENEEK